MDIIERGKFSYAEYGSKDSEETILLLHGLMGALSNFGGITEGFKDEYRVIIPILPIFSLPIKDVTLDGLIEYVNEFIDELELTHIHVLGNSLGGHLCQLMTLKRPDVIKSMTLTGSSGLFESALGSSFPKRGSYEYIKTKTEEVFADPKFATKELVDQVYNDVNDRDRALRIILTAKSAIRHNTGDQLHNIKVPTLIIWGKQDTVTPPEVAEKFHELIPHSELHWIDPSGHAPMMEKPEEFNVILKQFLNNL